MSAKISSIAFKSFINGVCTTSGVILILGVTLNMIVLNKSYITKILSINNCKKNKDQYDVTDDIYIINKKEEFKALFDKLT
jgi:hypothetical protein